MSKLVDLKDATIEPDLKVCCKDMAEDIRTHKLIVYKDKFKRMSTIDGGPSYYEVYTAKLLEGDAEVITCVHCGKDIVDHHGRLTIKYLAPPSN